MEWGERGVERRGGSALIDLISVLPEANLIIICRK